MSILKPVDDTRMFEKMGASLARSGSYEVFIIGFSAISPPVYDGITFIPLPVFQRLSVQRIAAKWRAFWRALKLRPSIIIFTTHELLFPAILLKILTPVFIIYDVRENYYRNLLLSGNFPRMVRWPLALYVRFREKLLAPAVDHFFLAEQGYEQEFKFHRAGWTVIENKATYQQTAEHPREKVPGQIRLLFSGTLSESTGVFRAIALTKGLHQLDSSISLTLVGYAALPAERQRILKEVRTHSFINLVGGDRLVPHASLVKCFRRTDFGILSYPASDHTLNSRPTKLFEYLAAHLPIIVERNWSWIGQFSACVPFVFVNFSKPDYPSLLKELKTKAFYSHAPEGVTWGSEEAKLLKALEQLIA